MPLRMICVLMSAFGLLLAPKPARAVDATVSFTATIQGVCSLIVVSNGVLAANATYDTLASTETGGSPGLVTVLTTSAAYDISTIAPAGFSTFPTNGNTSVTFSSTYSASGATTIGSTPGGTSTPLAQGLTALIVNLAAQKTTGLFPSGNYAAEVIVRCD